MVADTVACVAAGIVAEMVAGIVAAEIAAARCQNSHTRALHAQTNRGPAHGTRERAAAKRRCNRIVVRRLRYATQ
eukprot:4735333-Lingulodinium_polyedra.AAC.1